MPENDFVKVRPHPAKAARAGGAGAGASHEVMGSESGGVGYVELSVTSNFTFLTGASHPEELVQRAAELGHRAAAITDTNTLAGVVRAHVAAKQAGLALVVGCRVVVSDGPAVLVYPTDRAAYGRLCRMLTVGKRRAPKGECHLTLHDVVEHGGGKGGGMLAVIDPPRVLDERCVETIEGLARAFDDDRLSVACACGYRGEDGVRLEQLRALSAHTRVPLVACNNVLYHGPERRALQDVLTCVRHGCTIEQAGFRLNVNAERHLKSGCEMARLMRACPGAVERTVTIAQRAGAFGLDQLRYEYPDETCPPGQTPAEYLRACVLAGAAARYPGGIPGKTAASIEHELALINELRYEAYFLTCYDIVRFARSRGILCQGRGGAANSAVCFCLGITEVDPATHSLLFERFISRERNEPPDIDIDFEHERREEVLQYIYGKYGRERAAMTAEVISYRGRSAVRDVGKAMGLSEDTIDALAKNLDRWGDDADERRVREIGLSPDDPTVRRVIDLTRELAGFPRHLSQHVGGMVMTRGPLCELVPIENAAMDDRTVIEWDKDDIDAMGMLKVDCLGLGMLTCIRKALALLEQTGVTGSAGRAMTIADVVNAGGADGKRGSGGASDASVYEMISKADTVGVFQIESRAQMSMLPRLRPACFYDLVIEVAIVRPGPIQGGMVHPYLRRRQGLEAVEYPKPEVRAVLERTLGVPLFQEQAMQLAIVAAGFTPDQADGLRRSMAAWKRKGNEIYRYGQRLIEGMLKNGYERAFAERCFEQIKGFSDYGFPESHAASFAILVYVSAWLKKHHPAAFAAALINSQPMGFYQPAQIVRDATEHGVEVRAVDVNHSDWDCTLESGASGASAGTGPALRLGMRLVSGMPERDARRIAACVRERGRFASVEALWRASGASVGGLRRLAQGDAFGSMGLERQQALWQIKPLRDEELPLFEKVEAVEEAGLDRLPTPDAFSTVLNDYGSVGLSLKAHPIAFLREHLTERKVITTAELRDQRRCPSGRRVSVAGLVLCRQRPGTASGVTFVTVEDETGIANLIVWRDTYEQYRSAVRLSTVLLVHGTVERQGEVIHVHAKSLERLDDQVPAIASVSRDFH